MAQYYKENYETQKKLYKNMEESYQKEIEILKRMYSRLGQGRQHLYPKTDVKYKNVEKQPSVFTPMKI